MNVQFAEKAVILRGDRVLLIRKSASDPYHPLRWELPGGRLEGGETLDQNIKREVREELGMEVEPGQPLAMWSWTLCDDSRSPTVVAVARLCSPLSMASGWSATTPATTPGTTSRATTGYESATSPRST